MNKNGYKFWIFKLLRANNLDIIQGFDQIFFKKNGDFFKKFIRSHKIII